MKLHNILIMTVVTAFAMPLFAWQGNVTNTVKIKDLTAKRDSLKKQITIEDAKRGKVINGVTPETLESLNEKQDSICLDLRSRLVSVELQIKELVPDTTVAILVNQLNKLNLNQQGQGAANASATQTSTTAGGKK